VTPLDLVSKEETLRLLERVAEEFSAHTTLQDAEGNVLLEGGTYTTLCGRVRSRAQLLSFVCGLTNTNMLAEAKAGGAPVTDLCELGLFKTYVPLFHDGTFIGGLSACGVVDGDEPPEAFLVAKTLEIDESEAAELLKGVRTITSEEGQRLTDALANGLVAEGLTSGGGSARP